MTPDEIQAEWIHTLQGLAIQAAADYHAGIVDFAIFQEILASLYLAVDDNIDPTAEQIAEKISEMNTASAFISAGRAGRE